MKIVLSGEKYPKISTVGKKEKRLRSQYVEQLFGVEGVGLRLPARRTGVSLYAVRQFLISQLRSTGGRPGLSDATVKRNKVPMLEGDWEKLKDIAQYYGKQKGVRVTPAQAAASVLHLALENLEIPKK